MRVTSDIYTNERAALFMDYQDTLHGLARAGRQIDVVQLRDYLAEGRHLVEAFVYLPTHPQPERRADDQATLQRLRRHGFLVRSQVGQVARDGRLSCDFSLEMALDIQEFVARTHPDIVILAVSTARLEPLVQRLRLQGVRVEVAAAPGSVPPSLPALANGFVDLTQAGQPVDNLPIPAHDDEADGDPLDDDLLDDEADAVVPVPAD